MTATKKVKENLNDSNIYEQLATDPTEKFVQKIVKEISYFRVQSCFRVQSYYSEFSLVSVSEFNA